MRKLLFLILLNGIHVILSAVSLQADSSIIKGKVTDINGNALPGTVITIENTHTGVYTDSNGSYAFSGLKDGNYTLRFSFIGYETQLKEVKLKAEEVVNINLSPKPVITDEVFCKCNQSRRAFSRWHIQLLTAIF